MSNFFPRTSTETVVCLHSSMSSGRQWRALVADLEDRFHVITPNLLGYGDDSRHSGGRLRLEDEAAAVIRQLEGVAAPVHVVGHSFGGAVALRLATLHPEMVSSLTLYEPAWLGLLFADGLSNAETLEIRKVRLAVGSATPFGRWRGAREFVNYWAAGDAWSNLTFTQQRRLAALTRKVAAEFDALLAAGSTTQELTELPMPVRIIYGSRTRQSARNVAELLATIVPSVELQRIDGLAHMAPVTDAPRVNPLIVEHIVANAGSLGLAAA